MKNVKLAMQNNKGEEKVLLYSRCEDTLADEAIWFLSQIASVACGEHRNDVWAALRINYEKNGK